MQMRWMALLADVLYSPHIGSGYDAPDPRSDRVAEPVGRRGSSRGGESTATGIRRVAPHLQTFHEPAGRGSYTSDHGACPRSLYALDWRLRPAMGESYSLLLCRRQGHAAC